MDKEQLKKLVNRLIDEEKGLEASRLIDSVVRQDRIIWDMQGSVVSDDSKEELPSMEDLYTRCCHISGCCTN